MLNMDEYNDEVFRLAAHVRDCYACRVELIAFAVEAGKTYNCPDMPVGNLCDTGKELANLALDS